MRENYYHHSGVRSWRGHTNNLNWMSNLEGWDGCFHAAFGYLLVLFENKGLGLDDIEIWQFRAVTIVFTLLSNIENNSKYQNTSQQFDIFCNCAAKRELFHECFGWWYEHLFITQSYLFVVKVCSFRTINRK